MPDNHPDDAGPPDVPASKPNYLFDVPSGTLVYDATPLIDAMESGRIVRMRGCTFLCQLVFHNRCAKNIVEFVSCRFEGPVDFTQSTFARGLTFTKCRFRQSLTLASATVHGTLFVLNASLRDKRPLVIRDSAHNWRRLTVKGHLDVRGAFSDNTLNLYRLHCTDDVTFGGSRIRQTQSPESIDLYQSTILGNLKLSGGGDGSLRAIGQVDLRAARVKANVLFSGARISVAGVSGTKGVAVQMDSANVGGSIFFETDPQTRIRCILLGKLDLRAHVGGNLEFRGTLIDTIDVPSAEGEAVTLDSARVTESVDFCPDFLGRPFACRGRLSMSANVGGSIRLRGVTIAPAYLVRDEPLVSLHLVQVGEDVSIVPAGPLLSVIEGTVSAGQLRARIFMLSGVIEGHLILDQAHIEDHFGTSLQWGSKITGSLILDYARIGRIQAGNVLLGTQERAQVSAVHCQITTDATFFRYASLTSEMDDVPPAHDAGQSGNVMTSKAQWDFRAAAVGGVMIFQEVRIASDLLLNNARISGDLVFEKSAISRDLILRGTKVSGVAFNLLHPDMTGILQVGRSLDMDGASISNAIIRLSSFGKQVDSHAELRCIRTEFGILQITGSPEVSKVPRLLFEGTRFSDLNVSGFEGTQSPVTTNDTVRVVVWVILIGVVLVNAVMHRHFAIGATVLAFGVSTGLSRWRRRRVISSDVLHLLGLLRLSQFSPGFYLGVEQYLRREGDDAGADEVFISRRKRETQILSHERGQRTIPPVGRIIWHWVLDLSAGFGARTGRLLHLFILIFLLNWSIFSSPWSVERPLTFVQQPGQWGRETPLDRLPSRNPWPADGGAGEPAGDDPWREGHGFFLAMRISVPLVELISESDWEPASRPMFRRHSLSWCTYENYAASMMAANLILVPLLIAGATGFLKKQE